MEIIFQNAFVQTMAGGLRIWVDSTAGQWGPTPPELLWFRPPELHVVESIFFVTMTYLLFRLSRKSVARQKAALVFKERKPNWLDKTFAVIFCLCWVTQLVFKAMRPSPFIQMCWLLMPCHLITLTWPILLWRKMSSRDAIHIATLLASVGWGPCSAAAFPDWSDHQFRLEGKVFVVHHAMLCLMPFYFAARFGLMRPSIALVMQSVGVSAFVNTILYAVVGNFTGLNLNYQIYPPKVFLASRTILATPYYRIPTVSGLAVLTVFFHGITWLVALIASR